VAGCHQPPPGAGGGREITSNVEDWRDEVIYQIVVDRFADGDYSNNYAVEPEDQGRYHGGDWRGLQHRLDYLQQLGVTALWISPVLRNIEGDAGFGSYHGYWTQDFRAVNPHFGDLAQLQELVDAAHARGLKVIVDIVVNHIAPLFAYDINHNGRADDLLLGGGGQSYGSRNEDVPGRLTRASEWDPDYDSRGIQAFSNLGESGPAPLLWAYEAEGNRVPVRPAAFQNPAWYHRRGRITIWENPPALGQPPCEPAPDDNPELCPYVRQQEIFGDFPGGLKDLATERPDVRQALIEVYKFWLEVGDFDGFRIDTLKHVEPGFFDAFCPALRQHATALGKQRLLLFGEAFSGADALLAEYSSAPRVDSVLYFSQKFRVIDAVFKRGAPTAEVASLHRDRLRLFAAQPHAEGAGLAPAQALVNFLDNHDVPRFLAEAPLPALHNALVYLLTTVGIPCIYYGTEQELAGGADPANREDLWRGNPARGLAPYDTTNATFQLIQRLTALRRAHLPLRRGDFSLRWTTEHVADEPDAGLLAFERSTGGETVLVVINTRDCEERLASSAPIPTAFAAGTALQNQLEDNDPADRFTVGSDGTVEVTVPCRGAKILTPDR
jgi:glycosidase